MPKKIVKPSQLYRPIREFLPSDPTKVPEKKSNGRKGRTSVIRDRGHVIIAGVRKGLTQNLACELAKVGTAAFYRAMHRAEMDIENGVEGWETDLYWGIKEANSQLAEECLENVRNASVGGDWKASAWILERVHSRDYNPNVMRHEHVVKEPFKMVFNVSGEDIEQPKLEDNP